MSELAKLADKIAEIREIPTVNQIALAESTRNQIEELQKEIAIARIETNIRQQRDKCQNKNWFVN